jgi:hypothetical protein
MRKLCVTEFLALDGVLEEPGDWPRCRIIEKVKVITSQI